ncbi:uncharacterized protein LOC103712163 [Phoenix dactylifera]|uniref:Uncharacterized protein LOC103712163 n=1 Tax=Phoenix dactylifera TaxID=42345 RepID=A0A8B8J7A0_PHODC|nr:uncharacterized protein LOC103712163 [Phoenix dactylifera]XP_017699542.2 uncharacterized protein LOC103712163 [Phoenix dactylifera]XP_026662411.2 uncharacterized protein LOC103712163 [Phoenix dactylifera]XP_038982503.1 uncharacterized protein LOC103712163 [Phoenix dactylifera]
MHERGCGIMTTTMMLRRGGDLNLNSSVQACGDSIKEGLKQAMLQHEVILRNQVRELHRLYWTQKNLMHELCRQDSDVYSPRRASVESDGSAEEKRVWDVPSGLLMVNPTDARGNVHELRRNGMRNFDLELPAEEFTRDPGEESGGGYLGVKGSVSGENATNSGRLKANFGARVADDPNRGSCSNARVVIELEEEPLELESDGEANVISSSRFEAPVNNGVDKCGSPPTVSSDSVPAQNHSYVDHGERWEGQESTCHFADLNESIGEPSVKPSSQKQQTTFCKRMHIDLNIAQDDESIHSLPNIMPTFPSPSTSSSVVHRGDVWRESNNKCPKESESSNICPKESSMTIQHDLPSENSREKNVDWLFHGSQHAHPSFTQASAEGTKVSEYNDSQYGLDQKLEKCSAKDPAHSYRDLEEGFYSFSTRQFQYSVNPTALSVTGLHEPEDAKVDYLLAQPHSKNVNIDSRKPTLITTCSNDIEDNNLHASVGSTNLPPTVIRVLEDKQANQERSEEDTVSSHAVSRAENQQDEYVEESLIKKKPDHITGNSECTSPDKSVEEHAVLSIAADSGTTQDIPVAARFPGIKVPTPEASNNVHLLENSCNICKAKPEDNIKQQTTEAVEMDLVIVKAAERLLSISLENSTYPVYQVASNGQVEIKSKEGSDRPQYSSDSFETITLKLQEIRDDGQSRLAKPTENETGKDVHGVKLRRGRRLRDFQKDVLPGLISLSRHEICEDMHTIGYKLRRNRPSKSWGEKWFAPIRSRQSRRCSVVRRR